MIKMRIKGNVYATGIKGFENVVALGESDASGLVDCLAVFKADAVGRQKLSSIFVDPRVRITLAQDALDKQVMALDPNKADELRRKALLQDVAGYYEAVHKPASEKPFVPGKSRVNYAGRVFNAKEMVNLVDSSLEFYLTSSRYDRAFCDLFGKFLSGPTVPNVRTLTVNSGSSANLVALATLTSSKLGKDQLTRGDEVITVAAGFPTSIAPIIQNGLVPVFVDIDLVSLNIDVSQIEAAIGERTRAIMLAHTLGIPFDLDAILEIAEKYQLWVIEDNSDCLGGTYALKREYTLLHGKKVSGKPYTGTIGHLGTSSFYAAHQITMGEGGAVYTTDADLFRIALSFRDWGRDCWCDTGLDNTCGKRFEWQLGLLPKGYDHKYTYSHIGYNLKITDMQASVGLAQLDRLAEFAASRYANWRSLKEGLADLADVFHLPSHPENAIPSPFGFSLTLREGVAFSREDITQFLESQNIQTRTLFAGNMLRQPAIIDADVPLRIGSSKLIGSRGITDAHFEALPITDFVMGRTFWIGVFPGLKSEMLAYMICKIREFLHG